MAKLTVEFTENFDGQRAEALIAVLRQHFEVATAKFLVRCSADELPRIVQLLGQWQVWAGIGVVAGPFLARIGQRAADQLWDTVRDCLKTKEAKPLADISKALAEPQDGKRPVVTIGLDQPNEHFGTCVVLKGCDSEQIAYAMARFAVKAKEVSELMTTEIANGNGPATTAVITLLDNGGLRIVWAAWTKDRLSFVQQEREIP